MISLFALISIGLILSCHFLGQTQESSVRLASNYWIIFYVLGYFLPIPIFLDGSDGWSTIWGFTFQDKEAALKEALILTTLGGLLLSFFSRGIGRIKSKPDNSKIREIKMNQYILDRVSIFRLTILFIMVLAVLIFGIQIIGGLWNLIQNLGDRITLFAGLNGLFLPLNTLIGACFAISGARAANVKISGIIEIIAILATLPVLFLLGQKSNILILILGISIIKLSTARRIRLIPLILIAFIGINFLLMYEFIFREALIIGVDKEKLTFEGWSNFLWTQVTGNFMQIQNLTVLIDAMPRELAYTLGDTYIAIFSLIIPQQFFGVKPLTAAGVNTLAFWPDIVARESTTMPPGLFGEAYMNFSWFGFLSLCILIGLLLRSVDKPWLTGRERTAMDFVWVGTAGSVSLHFIRGELFSPLLILIGIYIGARLTLKRSNKFKVTTTNGL
jgi:oligosaccharide repeat unit polymerase